MRGHMLRKLATYDSGSIDDFAVPLAVQKEISPILYHYCTRSHDIPITSSRSISITTGT